MHGVDEVDVQLAERVQTAARLVERNLGHAPWIPVAELDAARSRNHVGELELLEGGARILRHREIVRPRLDRGRRAWSTLGPTGLRVEQMQTIEGGGVIGLDLQDLLAGRDGGQHLARVDLELERARETRERLIAMAELEKRAARALQPGRVVGLQCLELQVDFQRGRVITRAQGQGSLAAQLLVMGKGHSSLIAPSVLVLDRQAADSRGDVDAPGRRAPT